eukprot:scaffold74744_cov42-Phaeocystis_antarctica.AAC.1
MVKDRPGVGPHGSMVEVPSQSSEFRGGSRLALASARSRARVRPPAAPEAPERPACLLRAAQSTLYR